MLRIRYQSHIALALLLVAPFTAAGQHVPKLSVQKHKSEIEKLMALSTETAKKQTTGDVDAKTIASKCADELERARSYGSVAVILDRENRQLRSHNALGLSMTFDHVKPDRYHVVRNSWGGGPGYDFDEWITISDSEYIFTSVWFDGIEKALAPAGYDPRQENRDWGLQKYVDVLRGEQPFAVESYDYDGKLYYLLAYTFPASRHSEFPKYVASASASLRLWIDANASVLAQADLVSATEKPGTASQREFQQVFVAYSDDIRVDPPAEKCSKGRPAMCFAFIALSPTAGAMLAETKSSSPEKPAAEIKTLSYSNAAYRWSVFYPANWTVDSSDASFVRISSPSRPRADGLCGFHSGLNSSFGTVGEFADFMQAQNQRFFKQQGTDTRSSPKQQITLPNGVTGIDVTTDILSGGRSRRIYVLTDGFAFSIDCETYASNWENLESSFARIISSLTFQKKH